VAHILTKHKKPFTDGGIVKDAMTLTKPIRRIGANTVEKRVSMLSVDAVK